MASTALLRWGQVFASHAGIALKGAISEAGMEKTIESRDIIGQAKGAIVERCVS